MLATTARRRSNWSATWRRHHRQVPARARRDGYKFQFITLAGFHSLNYSMFELAHGYARNNMTAFVELQQKEFAAAEKGFTAVKHQREVGPATSTRSRRWSPRQGLDHRAARLDRGRAVLRRGRAQPVEEGGQKARP